MYNQNECGLNTVDSEYGLIGLCHATMEERRGEGLWCFRLAIYNGCRSNPTLFIYHIFKTQIYQSARWRYVPVGVTHLKEEEEEEEEEDDDDDEDL